MFCKISLPVDVIRNNQRKNVYIDMSKLAFVKHLAFAGVGFAPRVQKWWRFVGSFFLYSPYMSTFCQGHFVDPFNDPTEKGQFSNLAGKAIADFLSKKIDGAVFTINYEWAMRNKGLPVQGSRPDLLASLKRGVKIAIEAKGYSRGPGNISQHKNQAGSGNKEEIPVQFAVASVAYNLYTQIKVNYWDPEREDGEGEDLLELWRILSKEYYSELFTFIESGILEVVRREEFEGEGFYVLRPSRDWSEGIAKHLGKCWWCWIKCWEWPLKRTYLLFPERIKEFAKDGLPVDIEPFMFEGREKLYIDNDRVGIWLEME